MVVTHPSVVDGRWLEVATLAWNVIGIIVLTIAAVAAHSVALAGFGLDSLIEIGASTVVLWELSGSGEQRQRRALRLIAAAFLALATYITVQSAVVLATGYHSQHSPPWHRLDRNNRRRHVCSRRRESPHRKASGQPGPDHRRTSHHHRRPTGRRRPGRTGLQHHPELVVGRSDPAAGLVIVYYALREARTILTDDGCLRISAPRLGMPRNETPTFVTKPESTVDLALR